MRYFVTVRTADALHVVGEVASDAVIPEQQNWTKPERFAQHLADGFDNNLERRVWTPLRLEANPEGARALRAWRKGDDDGWNLDVLAHERAHIAECEADTVEVKRSQLRVL